MTPRAAPSRCTQRCGRLATKHGRCDEHQRKPWENTSQRNQALDKTEWARTKAEHLALEPACRACGSTTRLEVDHIIPVAAGGALYDHGNLQTLCHDDHAEKTRHERAQARQVHADD